MRDYAAIELLPYTMELRAWISDWYDCAIASGFVRPPFRLDGATADRLEGYFNMGLTPAEGAAVCFGPVH